LKKDDEQTTRFRTGLVTRDYQLEKRKTLEEKHPEQQSQNAECQEHIKFLTQELNISVEIADPRDEDNCYG